MDESPPIHLINLDRSVARLERFRERNSHLQNVVRVSAMDGGALDRETLIRSGYITNDLPYGPGALGCAMSHVKLWEMALSRGRCLTIFEDDVIVSRQFETRAKAVLSLLPDDWDIVLWGYVFNPLFLWIDLGVSKAVLHGYGPSRYQGPEGLSRLHTEELHSPVRLLHSYGTQGYSISPKGARAALEYCLPLRKRLIEFPDAGVITEDGGIDCALCGVYRSMQAFMCVPPLLIQCDEQESVRRGIDSAIPERV